jgi:transposase
MLNNKDGSGVAPGSLEGARSATGGEPGAAGEVKRWSAGRKKEVVLRLLRGEPVDAISREVSVPIFKLEQWRDRALAGIDAGLKERENDPVVQQLDDANRRIGELVMLCDERRAGRRRFSTRPRAAFTLPARPSALHVESLDRDVASFGSTTIAYAADWTGAGVSHPRSRP